MTEKISRIRQRIRLREYYLSSHAEEEMIDDELDRFDVEHAILYGIVVGVRNMLHKKKPSSLKRPRPSPLTPLPIMGEGDFYLQKIVDFCQDFNQILPLSQGWERGIKGVRAVFLCSMFLTTTDFPEEIDKRYSGNQI